VALAGVIRMSPDTSSTDFNEPAELGQSLILQKSYKPSSPTQLINRVQAVRQHKATSWAPAEAVGLRSGNRLFSSDRIPARLPSVNPHHPGRGQFYCFFYLGSVDRPRATASFWMW